MSRQWTAEQKNAIEISDGNILVNAAAGSGKTAVLVERVIQKVLNGCSVERLLIVTFTIKAAREMKDRLSFAIKKALAQDPNNRHLQRQSLLIRKAQISTIDSFYSHLVRNNFHLLDISPDFRIADEVQLKLLKSKVLQELIDEMYEREEDREDFLKFADIFSKENTDSSIENIVSEVSRFIEAVPFEKHWFEKTNSYYKTSNDFLATVWGQKIGQYLSYGIRFYINGYNDILVNLSDEPELYEKTYDIVKNEIETLEKMAESLKEHSWDDFVNCALEIKFPTYRVQNKFVSNPLKLKMTAYRNCVKKFIGSIEGFFIKSEDFKKDLQSYIPAINILSKIVLELESRMLEVKAQQNMYSFADISKFALKLCVNEDRTPTDLAVNFSKQYDEIMIDEYQDTNEIQDLIFTSISDNSNKLFLVGDVKQSIYGFRNACPDIFLKRKNEGLSKSCNSQTLNLSKNFRSRCQVLDFTNLIFEKIMLPEIAGFEYNHNERLYQGILYTSSDLYGAEIAVIDDKDKAYSDDDEQELSRVEKEASFVAYKINKMLRDGFTVTDKASGESRKAVPSDFAVLLRSTKNSGDIFLNELKKYKIGAYCEDNESYLDSYEVLTALSILRTIDNPYDDISLIASMRSPAFFFTADELASIRALDTKSVFFKAVKLDENIKTKNFLLTLERFRKLSRQLPVYRLLSQVYSQTGIFSLFGGMEGGQQRQNNLNQLLRQAKLYEANGAKGIYGFISFIDRLIEDKKGDIAGVKPLPDADCVTVSTIHKSKGLEYPICIIADAGKKFNTEDLKKNFLYHKDFGFGFSLVDTAAAIKYTTLPKEAVKTVKSDELLAEEQRILYVALTRAREKLIVVGSLQNAEKKLKEYYDDSEAGMDLTQIRNANTYFDWILPAVIRDKKSQPLLDIIGEKGAQQSSADFISYPVNVEKMIAEQDNGQENIAVKREFVSEIKQRLDFKYPYEKFSKIPIKVSVSELKGIRQNDEDSEKLMKNTLFRIPDFEVKKRINASAKGTAIHRVLQYLPIKEYENIDVLKKEIEQLYFKNIIDDIEKEAVDINKIMNFVNSDVYKKIISSDRVEREYRFTAPLNVSEYDASVKNSNETVLLQGVIDCYFEQGDEVCIVDYKSDKIKNSSAKEELSEKYSIQLKYYKYALEMLLNKKVTKCIIYSLDKSEEVEL